jgi:hypothetical protein
MVFFRLKEVDIYVPATFYSYDGSGNEGSMTGTGNPKDVFLQWDRVL